MTRRQQKRPKSNNGAGGDGDFYNPYNFIPAPPPTLEALKCEDLGQGAPKGHHAYFDDCYSGRIEISIEAVTPLLLLDTDNQRRDKNDHVTFDMLTDENDRPILRPTTLKGPLRTAFESVTNSRLGVFGHDEPLARRMNPQQGLAMIPARISDDGKELELFMGSHATEPGNWREVAPKPKGKRWVPEGNLMYAAWLPQYIRAKGYPHHSKSNKKPILADDVVTYYGYGTDERPEHGEDVVCWLRKIKYERPIRNGTIKFDYWRVEAMAPAKNEGALPKTEGELRDVADRWPDEGSHTPTSCFQRAQGRVCITNQNIGTKHDERVFFTPDPASLSKVPLKQEWKKAWDRLVRDYKEKAKSHLDERRKRNMPIEAVHGAGIGDTALSRHVDPNEKTEKLKGGDLCYARVYRDENGEAQIQGLYPVMIARELADRNAAPLELLPAELRPADDIAKLSPADQVFGWVCQKEGTRGKGAYKGQLRIVWIGAGDKPVKCFSEDLPLAILSSPKPEQVRFYAAKDENGLPYKRDPVDTDSEDGNKFDDKYVPARGLRGRKVYPHVSDMPEGYWDAPESWENPPNRRDHNRYREYLRAEKERNNQNRSVSGWIEPGTRFTAEIDVWNLTMAQLGALFYVLDFKNGCHKLGAGKPLGFGSVKIAIESAHLRNGAELRNSYTSLELEKPGLYTFDVQDAIGKFKKVLESNYATTRFEDISFIRAFEAAMRGYKGKPVHYPRAGAPPGPPAPEEKNYEWFVQNRQNKHMRVWLPAIGAETRGLPGYPSANRRASQDKTNLEAAGAVTGERANAARHGSMFHRPKTVKLFCRGLSRIPPSRLRNSRGR